MSHIFIEMMVLSWQWLTCCVFLASIVCSTSYPFETKNITVPSKPSDPFLLQFHHTRYSGKCFEAMAHNYPYNTIVPFIQNFDVLVTTCNMVWDNPFATRTSGSCIYVLEGRNTTPHTIERVHVQTDHRHHVHFVNHVLPYYIKRYNETGSGIILHTGGNDAPTRPDMIAIFLQTPAILRWVPEQSVSQEVGDHPKVMFLPTGICARENVGRQGVDLRTAIAESVPVTLSDRADAHNIVIDANNHSSGDQAKQAVVAGSPHAVSPAGSGSGSGFVRAPHAFEAASGHVKGSLVQQHSHRVLVEAMKEAKSWEERLDRVLLCYGEKGNKHRIKFMNYARSGNCTICDFCNGSMPALELWRMYGHYKFVLSPYGNGADCGRTWEIMLMGAVPVIEYFAGALGYERGGLATMTVTKPDELTAYNLEEWKKKHRSGPAAAKLSMEYWRDRIFNETNIL